MKTDIKKGLEINGLHLELENTAILNNISVDVKQGEIVGLIGPNGAGKSSLLKSILGLIKIKSGKITLDGENIEHLTLKERAKKLAYAAQGAPVYWPLTVGHIVGLGRVPHLNPWQRLTLKDENAIDNALVRTDTIFLKERLVTTLSGGERARVMLARVLATASPYVLADEPVASLDPGHQLEVMKILRDLTDTGTSVIVVMHDLGLALRFCDRLILLNKGELIAQDTPDIILSDQNLASVFGITATRWVDNGKSFLVPYHTDKGYQ